MKRIKRLTRRADELRRQIEGLKSSILLPPVSYGVRRAGNTPQDISSRFARIEDDIKALEDEWRAVHLERANAIIAAQEHIEKLEDSREQLAIAAYYIAGQSVKEISKRLEYSENAVYGFLKKGREHIKELAKDETICF